MRMQESSPRRISNSAVGPSISPGEATGNDAAGRPVRLNEAGADFTGIGCADGVVDAHPAHDVPGGATNVDVLAFVATPGIALDDSGTPTAGGELMSERGAGDPGARDDGVASHVCLKSCLRSGAYEGRASGSHADSVSPCYLPAATPLETSTWLRVLSSRESGRASFEDDVKKVT